MDTEEQHSTESVGCPRCDYDLSGEVRTWEDACPLSGVCPECGLVMRWGALLAKDARRPEAFFETSRANPRKAFIETFRRAKNPYRFWQWVKMEYEFNWKRMLLLSFGGMLALHAMSTVAAVAVCLVIFGIAMVNAPAFTNQLPTVLETIQYSSKVVGIPFLSDSRNWWYARSSLVGPPVWILLGLLSISAMPAAFMLLPVTLSKAKVRTIHLVRVMCYSFIWLPMIWFIFTGPSVLNSTLDKNQWFLGRVYTWGGGQVPQTPWQASFTYLMDKKDAIVGTFVDYEYAITIVVVLSWNVLWWWFAAKYYLRIPRPLLVSILLMILSTLAFMVLSLPIFGLEALKRLFPT
jgi:hypothetical protein